MDRIVGASPGPDILDVGCGTGISARQFQAAGCRVLGVDPDARMTGFARQTGLESEVATFEAWESAGRTFDAVIAGQAWHWVNPVAGAAKAAQVLRPGGRLTAFWNVYQPAREVAVAFAAVYRRVLPDSPFKFWERRATEPYSVMLATAADGIRQAGAFGEPEHWRFDWTYTYTRDEWLDMLPTQGVLTQVAPDKLAELLAGVGNVIDTAGGSFAVNFDTVAVTAARTAAA